MKFFSCAVESARDLSRAAGRGIIRGGNRLAHWWLFRFDQRYQIDLVSKTMVRLKEQARSRGASDDEIRAINHDSVARQLGLPTIGERLRRQGFEKNIFE